MAASVLSLMAVFQQNHSCGPFWQYYPVFPFRWDRLCVDFLPGHKAPETSPRHISVYAPTLHRHADRKHSCTERTHRYPERHLNTDFVIGPKTNVGIPALN